MTADELLKVAQAPVAREARKVCTIDPETRQITLPDGLELLGVESDQDTNRIYFECPKIVGDGVDLSERTIRINFRNEENEPDQYIVTDLQYDDEKVYFSWLLSRSATMQRGITTFVVCAVKSSGGVIEDEWNTTIASGNVLQGLEATVVVPDENKDVVLQLMELINSTADNAMNAITKTEENTLKRLNDAELQIGSVQDVEVSIDAEKRCAILKYMESAGGGELPDDWYTEFLNQVSQYSEQMASDALAAKSARDAAETAEQNAESKSGEAAASAEAAAGSATAASQSAGTASQKASDAISAASQAKGYMEQTKQLQASAIGDIEFSIDPTRGCLVAEY